MFRPTHYAIDFGTSNTLLAAANDSEVHPPVPIDSEAIDPTVLRSVLFFPSATQVFYGAAALREYVDRGMHGRLIRSIKKHLPSRSFIGTMIHDRPMNLEHLIGVMLGELRRRADAFFGAEVDRVVLGRPARFSADDDADRFGQYRLERAAREAGFREIHFCPEPIAAAQAFRHRLDQERLVLVCDFGGGTSDFTVVRMIPDGYSDEHVLAIGGLSIAGDAFDGSIMRHRIGPHFGTEVRYRVPLGRNTMTMPRSLREALCSPADLTMLRERDAMTFLRNVQSWSLGEDDQRVMDQLFTLIEDSLGFQVFESIEQSKRALSERDDTLFTYRYPTIDIEQPLRRAEFEVDSRGHVDAIVGTLHDTLDAASVTPADVDIVCCTGGTAKIPALDGALRTIFGDGKMNSLETFHSVILGLADEARRVARHPAA